LRFSMEIKQPRHLVEQLGLFKLPREIRSLDKDREEKAFENKLFAGAKDFFSSGKVADEEMKPVDKEALAV